MRQIQYTAQIHPQVLTAISETMSDQSSESEQGMISHDILQEPGSYIFIDKEHSSTTDC